MRSLIIAAAVLAPSLAAAHIQLDFPPPRTTMLKSGPCGIAGSTRGTASTTFAPGATITVKWRETINHPSHYRIAFDADGQHFGVPPTATDTTQGIDPTVIMDMIPDTTDMNHTMNITLPNIECTNCTLQVLQLMTDKPPYTTTPTSDDIYYQCADLKLVAAGGPDAGGGGGGPDAGPGGGGGPSSGGCATGGGTSLLVALALVGLIPRRRRC